MSREVMQQALDMLNEIADEVYCDQRVEEVITALEQALEEKQEPLCWTVSTGWVYADDTSQERVHTMAKQEHEPVASEELHLKAAAYANRRKEAYLDYVKKGENLSEEMINWLWVAHYEGYRDAVQETNREH